MFVQRIPAGIYAANCYIIHDETTKDAVIIDPAGDFPKLVQYIESKELVPKGIILTHGHGDHIGAVDEIKRKFDIEVYICENDEYMIKDAEINLSSQMSGPDIAFSTERFVGDRERIDFGSVTAEILHTPGHTEGSICIKIENHLFTGDTLFAGSIGRTDLDGGSYKKIMKSLNLLMGLSEDLIVYPGHGPSSTIAKERQTNPYVR